MGLAALLRSWPRVCGSSPLRRTGLGGPRVSETPLAGDSAIPNATGTASLDGLGPTLAEMIRAEVGQSRAQAGCVGAHLSDLARSEDRYRHRRSTPAVSAGWRTSAAPIRSWQDGLSELASRFESKPACTIPTAVSRRPDGIGGW